MTSDEVDLAKPLHITVKVNDEVVQDDTTTSMIKSFAELITYVSTFMTLNPGDILATGTPVKLKRHEAPVGSNPAIQWRSRCLRLTYCAIRWWLSNG